MNEKPRILSAFQGLDGPPSGASEAAGDRPAAPLVFDACQVGVILRAVLAVEALSAVAVMFEAGSAWGWLARFSVVTGAVLPATLAWLIAACSLKRPLARLGIAGQYLAGALLGAIAGLYGCGLLVVAGFADLQAPWLASALAGAMLASQMVAALVWRARARAPADTVARLAELQSRIRPHFLFNTLNTAVALVREEPARAEAILEDLAELFRRGLQAGGDAVPLAQELELARLYLDIERARFGERLRVHWQLDPAAEAALLPPLLLQPLVENAVRHGVEPSPDGADIEIRTERRGARVVVKIANTVPHGSGERGMGLALANVRARLALLHDLDGSFRSGRVDGWYRVRIEVPAAPAPASVKREAA